MKKAYIELLDNYIGSKLVVPGKYSVPVLDRVKRRKQNASGNPIDGEHSNPIINTRVYKLELPDGRVDECTVNITLENIIDQVDDQGWDTGIIEYILSFWRDPDVPITTGEQAYKNINGIKLPIITKKVLYAQVKCRDKITDWVTQHLIKE